MDEQVNTILQGDCIEVMNQRSPGTVDLVFADPPFNIGYDYDVYDDRQEKSAYLDWSRKWIGAVHWLLKPNGTFWLAIGDEYAAELKVISQEIGFHSRSWVIWVLHVRRELRTEIYPVACPFVLFRERPGEFYVSLGGDGESHSFLATVGLQR